MGFGSSTYLPMQVAVVQIDRDSFIEAVRPEYEAWLESEQESRAKNSPDYAEYISDLGFPALETLLDHPFEFNDLFTSVLPQEVLAACVGENFDSMCWVINSVDKAEAIGSRVVLTCKAFARQGLR